MVTQSEIANRLDLDVSSVNKILNRSQGPVFRKETVRKVFTTAREMGYDFNRIKYRHRRRHGRRAVNVGARVYIFRLDGTLYDQGVATIRDIGPGGAGITNLNLQLGSLPTEPFSVELHPLRRPLKSMDLRGRVVRSFIGEGLVLGLAFDRLDSETRRRLQRIASN